MKGRIFLIRDRTYCAIFDFPGEPISIIGHMYEYLTPDSVIRAPMVIKYDGEPIICPYCMCSHNVPETDQLVYPNCDIKRRKSIVRDELNIQYTHDRDGYYVKHR